MRLVVALLVCLGMCSKQAVLVSIGDAESAAEQSDKRLDETVGTSPDPTTAADHGAPDKCVPEGTNPNRLTDEQLACIGEPYAISIRELQEADPAEDARRQAAEGDYRLLSILGDDGWSVPGIACAFDVPETLIRAGLVGGSFSISEGYRLHENAQLNYVRAFNRAQISDSRFPWLDVCRLRTEAETDWRVYRDLSDFQRAPKGTLPLPHSLHTAVRSHDLAATRRLLRNGANPDDLDEWGLTALAWAVLTGREDLIEALLAAGADASKHGKKRPTPLGLAVTLRNLAVVRQLVAGGANVNTQSPDLYSRTVIDEGTGGMPLWIAVKSGEQSIARLLLDKGADPDIPIAFQGTPIFAAIQNERSDLVDLLIKHDADVRQRDGLGLSAIQRAAGRKRVAEVIRSIARAGGLADARSRAERTLWQEALEQGQLEILADLVAFGANTRLLKSTERKRLRAYIGDGLHKDVLDLLALGDQRAVKLESAIKAGEIARVRALYTGGAEIAEGRMRTGLIMAVEARQPKLVAWFLEQGADPLAPVYHAHQFWLHKKFPVRVARLPENPALVLAFEYGPVESVRLMMQHGDVSRSTFKPWREWVLGAALGGYESDQPSWALETAVESSKGISNLIDFDFKGHQDAEIVDLAVELSGIPKRGYEADDFLGDICLHMSDFGWQQKGAELLERYLARGYRPRQVRDAPFKARRLGDRPAVQTCFEAGARQALLILRYGADPNEPGRHLLSVALTGLYRDAAYHEVIDELLKRGVDPNDPDSIVTLDAATPHERDMQFQAMSLLFSEAQQSEQETDSEEIERRFGALKQEWRQRFADARRLLLKHGAKTRAQLEQDGILEPIPESKPKPAIPVR